MTCVNADTVATAEVLPPRSFDLLVTDAPTAFNAAARAQAGGSSRRPFDLLRSALLIWREALRPGGAMGGTWNTFVAKREALEVADDERGARRAALGVVLELRAPSRSSDPERRDRCAALLKPVRSRVSETLRHVSGERGESDGRSGDEASPRSALVLPALCWPHVGLENRFDTRG